MNCLSIQLFPFPLENINKIIELVERQTMAVPQIRSDLAKRSKYERERINGFIRRSVEIQNLYLARTRALLTTVEFLMECRPNRSVNGEWVGISGGESLKPPKEVQFMLNEVQQHLDEHNREVPL